MSVIFLVRLAGFEPALFGSGGQRFIQLSYRRKSGGREIRTPVGRWARKVFETCQISRSCIPPVRLGRFERPTASSAS